MKMTQVHIHLSRIIEQEDLKSCLLTIILTVSFVLNVYQPILRFFSVEDGIQLFKYGMLELELAQLERYVGLRFLQIVQTLKKECFLQEIIKIIILCNYMISELGILFKHQISRNPITLTLTVSQLHFPIVRSITFSQQPFQALIR